MEIFQWRITTLGLVFLLLAACHKTNTNEEGKMTFHETPTESHSVKVSRPADPQDLQKLKVILQKVRQFPDLRKLLLEVPAGFPFENQGPAQVTYDQSKAEIDELIRGQCQVEDLNSGESAPGLFKGEISEWEVEREIKGKNCPFKGQIFLRKSALTIGSNYQELNQRYLKQRNESVFDELQREMMIAEDERSQVQILSKELIGKLGFERMESHKLGEQAISQKDGPRGRYRGQGSFKNMLKYTLEDQQMLEVRILTEFLSFGKGSEENDVYTELNFVLGKKRVRVQMFRKMKLNKLELYLNGVSISKDQLNQELGFFSSP